MKSFSVLFAAAALFSAITGCQKESAGKQEANEADVYIQYTINFEDGMTRADYNSDAVSIGTDAEHTVKNAYIYFFDNANKYVKTVAIAAGDITSTAVEGNIVKKTTVPTKLKPGTYSVYATINYEVSMVEGTTTASNFAESVYTHDYTTYTIDANGIPMSSRAADGTLCQTNVVVDSYNTFENPVQIQLFMERMVAKLTVKTNKENNAFTVKTERDGTGDVGRLVGRQHTKNHTDKSRKHHSNGNRRNTDGYRYPHHTGNQLCHDYAADHTNNTAQAGQHR
jgi:hypothetical protein